MKDTFDFRKLFSLLLIVGIAMIFSLQFGPGSRGCEAPLGKVTAGSAATVNGKEISTQEFARAYARQMSFLRSQGQPITEQLARQFGMPKQVLNQMVDSELLAQAAEQRGIAPSDEELAKLIHRNADFQKDGKFDAETYRRTLRDYYRKTDVEFEAELRRQLGAQLMIDTVENAAAVSEDEVKANFLKNGNKAQLTFVRFSPTLFADKVPAPTQAEVDAFKKSHAKEIEDYYNANKFQFSQPAQVRARHILIKVPEGATEEQKKAAQEKAANIRKEIEGGKDFAQLATQNSEDPGTKDKGGDLGFNTAESFVKPFSDAAFGLKEGEVSQPVETQFGYHIIKTEEKKPPTNRPLDEASAEIAGTMLKKEKSQDMAKAAAEKASADMKGGKDLKTLFPAEKKEEGTLSFAASKNPEATESGEFNASVESVPRLGPAPAMLPDVFSRTTTGPLEKVYPIGDSFVVATVTDRKLPAEAEYETKKEELRTEARRAKQYELRDQFLKALRDQGQVVISDTAIDKVLGPAS